MTLIITMDVNRTFVIQGYFEILQRNTDRRKERARQKTQAKFICVSLYKTKHKYLYAKTLRCRNNVAMCYNVELFPHFLSMAINWVNGSFV